MEKPLDGFDQAPNDAYFQGREDERIARLEEALRELVRHVEFVPSDSYYATETNEALLNARKALEQQ